MFLRIRVQGGEEHQHLGGLIANDRERVLRAGWDGHGMVLWDNVGFPIDAHFQSTLHDYDQLVNGVGVQRRSGPRFAGVKAEGAGDALLPSSHVPFAIAGPPGHFRRFAVVDDRHDCPPVRSNLYPDPLNKRGSNLRLKPVYRFIASNPSFPKSSSALWPRNPPTPIPPKIAPSLIMTTPPCS